MKALQWSWILTVSGIATPLPAATYYVKINTVSVIQDGSQLHPFKFP